MHTINNSLPAFLDLPLSACPAGVRGWISRVDDGPDANRLKAMGLCAGHLVSVMRAGDPMVVDVFTTRVAVAQQLASGIRITSCREMPRD